MTTPPVVSDITHSKVLDTIHKVNPEKIGAYRAIWSNSNHSILLFPVHLVQSIVATLGLGLYGAGIAAAWALPTFTGAVIGTFTSPIFSLIGLMRGETHEMVRFGYMSGGCLGGLFGSALAYALCSLGNGVTSLAVGGKSVKQLYRVNSPQTLAIFSVMAPMSKYNRDPALGLREDREITYERIVKPVKKLNYGDYQKWGKRLEAELKEKKELLLQPLKEGNIARFGDFYANYAVHNLSKDDVMELYDINLAITQYNTLVNSIQISPHGLGLVLTMVPSYLINGNQGQADSTVELVRNLYNEALQKLKKIEEILPVLEKDCQEFMEKVSSHN